MNLIGPGFRDDINYTAEGSPILGGIEVGLDDNLLNGINGRLDSHATHYALGVVQTVDQLKIVIFGISINGDSRGLAAIIGAVAADGRIRGSFTGSWSQLDEVYDVAAGNRNVLYNLLIERRSHAGGIGLE